MIDAHYIELEVDNNPKEAAKDVANTIAEDEYKVYIEDYYKDRETIKLGNAKIDGHDVYFINTYGDYNPNDYRLIVIFDFDGKQYKILLDTFRKDYKELYDTYSIEK